MTTQLPGFWNSRRMDASLVFFFSLFLDPDLRLTRRIQDFWIWMSKWDQESCKFLPRHHENRLSFPPGGCIYWIIHGTYQILTTEAKRSPVETSPHGSSSYSSSDNFRQFGHGDEHWLPLGMWLFSTCRPFQSWSGNRNCCHWGLLGDSNGLSY